MMAVGLKYSAQVMGYVPLEFKERIDRLREHDPRLSMSRMIHEALIAYLPTKEKEAKIHPSRPSRTSPKQ